MVKAFVHNGIIVPQDPLPADWGEGVEVAVEKVVNSTATVSGDTDAWMDAVEAILADGDPADDARLEEAIQQVRRREKEVARTGVRVEP